VTSKVSSDKKFHTRQHISEEIHTTIENNKKFSLSFIKIPTSYYIKLVWYYIYELPSNPNPIN